MNDKYRTSYLGNYKWDHILLGIGPKESALLGRRDEEKILNASDGHSFYVSLDCLSPGMPIAIRTKPQFFDAEDMGIEGNPKSYALGAQYFANHLPIQKPRQAIILDMVGDADLFLPIERNSYVQNPNLVKTLWTLADDLSLNAFEKQLMFEIYDDHVPLWEIAQIPAIDIIDFMYPNQRSNFWHTHEDIPKNCSAESLYQVGTLLVHYIFDH